MPSDTMIETPCPVCGQPCWLHVGGSVRCSRCSYRSTIEAHKATADLRTRLAIAEAERAALREALEGALYHTFEHVNGTGFCCLACGRSSAAGFREIEHEDDCDVGRGFAALRPDGKAGSNAG